LFDDVVIYGFECLAHWGEQLFGQAAEEQVTDQVDVARGGFDDGSPTPGSQPNLRRPPIRCSEAALDQSAALHSLTGRRFDLVPTRANGQPAFGAYVRAPDGISHGVGLFVLALTGDRIRAMTRFENSVLPWFGLPRSLPSR
jgi:hypothetical protein